MWSKFRRYIVIVLDKLGICIAKFSFIIRSVTISHKVTEISVPGNSFLPSNLLSDISEDLSLFQFIYFSRSGTLENKFPIDGMFSSRSIFCIFKLNLWYTGWGDSINNSFYWSFLTKSYFTQGENEKTSMMNESNDQMIILNMIDWSSVKKNFLVSGN